MPKSINNRYLRQESLGKGAMGTVYRTIDRLMGEAVAIKRVTIPDKQLQFASRSKAKACEDIKLALAQEFQIWNSAHDKLRKTHLEELGKGKNQDALN